MAARRPKTVLHRAYTGSAEEQSGSAPADDQQWSAAEVNDHTDTLHDHAEHIDRVSLEVSDGYSLLQTAADQLRSRIDAAEVAVSARKDGNFTAVTIAVLPAIGEIPPEVVALSARDTEDVDDIHGIAPGWDIYYSGGAAGVVEDVRFVRGDVTSSQLSNAVAGLGAAEATHNAINVELAKIPVIKNRLSEVYSEYYVHAFFNINGAVLDTEFEPVGASTTATISDTSLYTIVLDEDIPEGAVMSVVAAGTNEANRTVFVEQVGARTVEVRGRNSAGNPLSKFTSRFILEITAADNPANYKARVFEIMHKTPSVIDSGAERDAPDFDSLAAFNKAFDKGVNGKGYVEIPEGSFNLSDKLLVNQAGLTLKGEGAVLNNALVIASSKINVSDLTIEGSPSNGFMFSRSQEASFINLRAQDNAGAGFLLGGMFHSQVTNGTFINCVAEGNHGGAMVLSASDTGLVGYSQQDNYPKSLMTITNAGSGMNDGIHMVWFTNGTGTGANGVATVVNGQLTKIESVLCGEGYAINDVLGIVAPAATARHSDIGNTTGVAIVVNELQRLQTVSGSKVNWANANTFLSFIARFNYNQCFEAAGDANYNEFHTVQAESNATERGTVSGSWALTKFHGGHLVERITADTTVPLVTPYFAHRNNKFSMVRTASFVFGGSMEEMHAVDTAPSNRWYDIDAAVGKVVTGGSVDAHWFSHPTSNAVDSSQDFANDLEAAAQGIGVGEIYNSSGIVRVRVS